MSAVEKSLAAIGKIPANSGHSLHKGTPREAFIREFLENHLPANLAIGTGEIIDAQSKPGAARNQFDIVIYRQNYPKLDFGGGISAFLIESVIATIEVKSTLTESELTKAVGAANACKSLTSNIVRPMTSGFIPPKALNYVVAYNGPAQMRTVAGWLPGIHKSLGIALPTLPTDNARWRIPSPSLDGVFVLEKGFVYFDNAPSTFTDDAMRQASNGKCWVYGDATDGALFYLFLLIQSAVSNIDGGFLNSAPYAAGLSVNNVDFV